MSSLRWRSVMQGLRLKFGDRRNDWKCCFCCHVRTGTIFIGIWHLMLHILILSTMAVLIRHPEYLNRTSDLFDQVPALPTPQASEVDSVNTIDISGSNLQIIRNDGSSVNPQPLLPHSYRELWDSHRNLNHQDLNVGVVVTFCTFAMTLLLLYGAVKGKPSYLMPFFCLQVFDFCVATISAVGYICYPPDITKILSKTEYLPFKSELEKMNPQTLTLLTAILFFLVMSAKAYFIGVVWSCYKYLTLRQVAAQRTVQFIDPDVQNLLPDLPDYETAVKKYPTPPPSYASAMQGYHHPLTVDINNTNLPNNSQPLSAQNIVVPPAVPIGAVAPQYNLGQVNTPQQV